MFTGDARGIEYELTCHENTHHNGNRSNYNENHKRYHVVRQMRWVNQGLDGRAHSGWPPRAHGRKSARSMERICFGAVGSPLARANGSPIVEGGGVQAWESVC